MKNNAASPLKTASTKNKKRSELKCKLGTTSHQFLMQITVESNSTLDAKLFHHFPDLIIFCEMVSRNNETVKNLHRNGKMTKDRKLSLTPFGGIGNPEVPKFIDEKKPLKSGSFFSLPCSPYVFFLSRSLSSSPLSLSFFLLSLSLSLTL